MKFNLATKRIRDKEADIKHLHFTSLTLVTVSIKNVKRDDKIYAQVVKN